MCSNKEIFNETPFTLRGVLYFVFKYAYIFYCNQMILLLFILEGTCSQTSLTTLFMIFFSNDLNRSLNNLLPILMA